MRMSDRSARALSGLLAAALAGPALAQLRVAEWNVTNYSQGRVADFKTALYGAFDGRSLAPDILIGQEFLSQAGVDNFLSILNTAPGSPGDWKAAPFFNGPDTDSAFFYRDSKVTFIAATIVSPGGNAPQHPRHLLRYDIRPKDYTSDAAILACYSSHMKAGIDDTDKVRRLDEAQAMRADAAALPSDWNYLLGSDLNIRGAGEEAYKAITDPATGADGLFYDPIASPADWYGNFFFRFIHTQDPVGDGGMDDRFDQILSSASLLDAAGFEYIGDHTKPFSMSTWNDPNHSYRCWGNDGTSLNLQLTVEGNTMVGPVIAQALRNAAAGGGHLPVYLDLRVPAKIDAPTVIDFGTVEQGAIAEEILEVTNSADTALWTVAGIADLNYDLLFTPGFASFPGPFVEPPGGGPGTHSISMDTTNIGPKSGLITIPSDAPDNPILHVELKGEVIADPCYPDFNGDDVLDFFDFLAFTNAFNEADPEADCTQDQTHDLFDFLCFVNAFNEGC
jgi:hypothetical protein